MFNRQALRALALLWCAATASCGGGESALMSEIPSDAAAGGTNPGTPVPAIAERESRRFEFESYKEVERLFEELNYTPEAWQAGVREVPRVYITKVSERWRAKTTKEISVQTKKYLFFRALTPLVLHANEMIVADRQRVEALANAQAFQSLSPEERQWLNELAARYKIDLVKGELTAARVDELLRRVDIVPVSLALSQGAEESGWGTSRFAAEGNALFGQWTWGENAMKPKRQRASLGNYGLAAFETPLESVLAYMHNLNTHRAYTELRTRRAELRAAAEPLSGRALAKTLTRYSERGADYVKALHAIMSVNQLDAADAAYLGNGPAIYRVPVGEGA